MLPVSIFAKIWGRSAHLRQSDGDQPIRIPMPMDSGMTGAKPYLA